MTPLLNVQHLCTSFSTPAGKLDVVADVSFHIHSGEAVGIVGESGSGKTMTGLSILDLVPGPAGKIRSGEILFKGVDILQMPSQQRQQLRGNRISMIFQDPMSSLSPFYTVGYQIAEAMRVHQRLGKAELRQKTLNLLQDVGIMEPERRSKQFPHQFSGGMRQRIMIAMALANDPELLIADEPTTALDVTIQAQVLGLLADKRKTKKSMSLLLISHNWGVISALCDRVIVMYAGRIVEEGRTADVYARPKHPYTQALLRSIPRWEAPQQERLPTIAGYPPGAKRDAQGCAFVERCEQGLEICHQHYPPERLLHDQHRYSCFHA